MFWSVAEAFKNCTTSLADVKELVPEFFYLPNFLDNENQHVFGKLQSGREVDGVELPPWAEGSAHKFVSLHREALEGEFVSAHLHLWSDLLCGCKPKGAEARAALNSFYFLTYQDAIDTEALKAMPPEQRLGIEAQIADYGQTPRQLFTQPHPARRALAEVARPVFFGPELPGKGSHALEGLGASRGVDAVDVTVGCGSFPSPFGDIVRYAKRARSSP